MKSFVILKVLLDNYYNFYIKSDEYRFIVNVLKKLLLIHKYNYIKMSSKFQKYPHIKAEMAAFCTKKFAMIFW